MTRTLLTVGHGALEQEQLGALLTGAGVQTVADIRRFPGSRMHPHVSSEALADWLPAMGISYDWQPRLGGRRRLPKGVDSPDAWWMVEAFRAYAAYTRTADFAAALDEVLDEAHRRTVAIMCSESVWWRCHRRLVADVAVLARGIRVLHVMHSGKHTPHAPAEGARLQLDGLVVWDGERDLGQET